MHLVRSFTVLLLLLPVSRAEWFRHGASCSEQVFGCSPEGIATSFGSATSSVTQGNLCITSRKGDCRTEVSYLISHYAEQAPVQDLDRQDIIDFWDSQDPLLVIWTMEYTAQEHEWVDNVLFSLVRRPIIKIKERGQCCCSFHV